MNFIKEFYNLIVGVVAGVFGIAVSNGLVDKLASMFLLLSLFTIGVLAAEYTVLLIEKKNKIRELTEPLVKAFCTLAIFLFLSIGSVIAIGIDNNIHTGLYFLTWSYTGIIVSAYIIQLLHFGKRLGLPGMAKLIEIVENFSSIFTKFKK
ncbi:hypothetical protein [Cytobacillus sp. NCCP-133]|uniref:hypothetical protein n=1 Tax=Cytobacillus sp. NCCP-133 TaxID=766848 RepID=UPI00222F33E4|nr:hypothetical protein [Cytobacillus sp. NCCP-133]GLB58683.1 hypothetical protein NCCP133_08160 [Cytobacillus sp. NCCP-133]